MIKLIAFDLDGTLLTYDKHVTDRTRQTLAKAAAAGIECVPITGRPYSALPAEVLDLPGVNYVVAASGADIRDNRSGEILKKDLIDKNLIVEILTLLRNNGYVTMAFMDSRGYVEKEDFKKALDWALDGPFREYFLKNRTPVDDLIGMVRDYPEDIEKFTVNLPKD
ncbi:MAG: HAD family phosphatase, partial [Lachnospiraceae bacterium]|nr:HAD family phosphatase [Candidatus Equihabitans merdae]